MAEGYASFTSPGVPYSGSEPFSDPYNITMAFWYQNTVFLDIEATITDRLQCSASTASVNAYSDDAADAGHTASASISLAADTWNHAAAVWSASDARKAYSNGGTLLGGAEATDTANTALSLTSAQLNIGMASSNAVMADLAIWNTALTDTEIAFLANGGRPHQLTSRFSNLVFYIPNRRTLVENVVSGVGDITVDDQTGRLSSFTGGNIVYPARYMDSVSICPAHKE